MAATAAAQDPPTCADVNACRQQAREAIDARQFERAHDLAWLAYQKGPKQDPATLTLIARTQSLSGRADDALVMLRRLADAGVVVDDVHEGEDFRRVRSHSAWPELLALIEGAKTRRSADAAASATPSKAEKDLATGVSEERTADNTAKPDNTPPSSAAAPADASMPPSAAVTLAFEDLAFPGHLAHPVALAYDAVSARFVFSGAASDALTVLSQTSTNAASFTSRGWSGTAAAATAIAIDRAAGDLWVAVTAESGPALHRLQLISGRRLAVIAAPVKARPEFIALSVARDGVYLLDRAERRIYRRAPQATTLAVHARLADDIAPLGLAHARTAIYVSHAGGLLRIDAGSRRRRAVNAANKEALTGLHSLAWHDGVLFGIQRTSAQHLVVRLELNPAGTAVTRVEHLGQAASTVATLDGGVYYYLIRAEGGDGVAVRAINAAP